MGTTRSTLLGINQCIQFHSTINLNDISTSEAAAHASNAIECITLVFNEMVTTVVTEQRVSCGCMIVSATCTNIAVFAVVNGY